MCRELQRINERPTLFSHMTVADLWTDPHISGQMLRFHLDPSVDASSRRADFVARSVAWIADSFGLGAGVRVLDLGCGPGLYTGPFARAGADVTGVDFAPLSIEYARRRASTEGLTIDYVNADYLVWDTAARFDLVTLIFLDVCPLAPDQRDRLLRKIARWLAPDGVFLFDVASIASLSGKTEAASYAVHPGGGFWSPEPHFEFANSYVYPDAAVTLDKYEIVEAGRTRAIYNWMQHFGAESIAAELASAGLEVERLLGDVVGAEYDPAASEFAVVARRRRREAGDRED